MTVVHNYLTPYHFPFGNNDHSLYFINRYSYILNTDCYQNEYHLVRCLRWSKSQNLKVIAEGSATCFSLQTT